MQKIYVLDTNILMQYPEAIFGFEDNEVVIPMTVLEELDNHKGDHGEAGFNARTSIRSIRNLLRWALKHGESPADGIELKNGGIFRVETDCLDQYQKFIPKGWQEDKPDNQIICVAKALAFQEEVKNRNRPVILVTNDAGMYAKAVSIGLTAQELRLTEVNPDQLYTGRLMMDVTDGMVEKLRAGGYTAEELEKELNELVPPNENGEAEHTVELVPNEFLELSSVEKGMFLGKISPDGAEVLPLPDSTNHPFSISPRKNGQKMMWDALFNPDIPLIIVNGIAGTGKTLLATAYGLDFSYSGQEDNVERRFIYTRTRTLGEEDPGYLKGDLNEKMKPLMAPLYDNLRVLFKDEDPEQARMHIDDMIADEVIELVSMAYIRGRSIPNATIVIDEAQNATPRQILEIVTRCAVGTKIIVMGDPDQIDNTKLSKRNNGLNFIIDRMKGSPLAATITFKEEEAVRSPLAIEAAKRLRVE